MNKEYSLQQFNQFRPMIEKAVWIYSKKYKLDYDDVIGQGYLIFCSALKKLDINKASFSTYLYHELRRLNTYCKKEHRISYCEIIRYKPANKVSYSKNIFITWNPNNNKEIDNYDIFKRILYRIDYERELSKDAQDILNHILSRDWENVNKGWKPSFRYILKLYKSKGWTKTRVDRSWNEIKEWWQSENKDQFTAFYDLIFKPE